MVRVISPTMTPTQTSTEYVTSAHCKHDMIMIELYDVLTFQVNKNILY